MIPKPPDPTKEVRMLVQIHINKLIAKSSIGITSEERARPQPLTIDLTLLINAAKAIQTDDIIHTINYSKLQKTILEVAHSTSFNLLESLAFAIISECFESDSKIEQISITVQKPYILPGSESAGTTLTITRHEYDLLSARKQSGE